MLTIKEINAASSLIVYEQLHQLGLDTSDIRWNDFRLFFHYKDLVGFVRIEDHDGFYELRNMAVLDKYQGQGYGREMISMILQEISLPVFLLTVKPDFFIKSGFYVANREVPEALRIKLKNAKQHHPDQQVVLLCQNLVTEL